MTLTIFVWEKKISQWGMDKTTHHDIMNQLQAKGVATFGALAFLSSFQPGRTDETPFIRALETTLDVKELDITTAELVAFRRLYCESHTLALGDLRSRMERKDDDTPRRLPMDERAERLASLKGELSGLTIDAQLEPAQRLVDHTIQQAEDNTLRFIALKECFFSRVGNHSSET